MYVLAIAFFLVLVFWAYRMLRRENARLSQSLMVVGVVIVAGLMLYGLLFENNPWHKGKRALAWGQQLQDWRTQQEADEAALALDEIGEAALAALSIALESTDPKVSKKAADVVAGICSRSTEFNQRHRAIFKYMLLVMKDSPDPAVRAHLADALARCGPVANTEVVIDGLTSASQNDTDAAVRTSAAEALAVIKTHPKR
jgi:hypothetical protein